MTPLHPVTRQVLGYGLTGGLAPADQRRLNPTEWATVHGEVARNGLCGLLAAAWQDDAIVLTAEQLDDLRTLQRVAMTAALRIEAVARDVIELLESEGIAVRLLKGIAVAHLDYPDPAWREFGDADLLVQASDLDRAVAVLAAKGHPRDLVERRPGFDRRFGKGVTIYGPNHVEIDLHRTFIVGAFGLRQCGDDLWNDSTAFELGGQTVQALVPEDRFLHACFAAVLGNRTPRPALLRDIVQLLQRGDLDATAVADRTARWRCLPVVTAALAAATRAFGVLPASPVLEWAANARPRLRDRALLATYPGFGAPHPAAHIATLFVVPGIVGKLTYARDLMLPSRAYRQARRRLARRHGWRLILDGLANSVRRT